MAQPEILEKRPVSIAHVKDMMKTIKERDEELSFRGGKTEDYVNDIAALSPEKADECVQALEALDLPRLKDIHFIKIIDLMPESSEHLKIILSGYNVTVTKESLDKIIEVLDGFRP